MKVVIDVPKAQVITVASVMLEGKELDDFIDNIPETVEVDNKVIEKEANFKASMMVIGAIGIASYKLKEEEKSSENKKESAEKE